MAGRLDVALGQMQLCAPERQPLHGDAEGRRGDRFGAEQIDVEID